MKKLLFFLFATSFAMAQNSSDYYFFQPGSLNSNQLLSNQNINPDNQNFTKKLSNSFNKTLTSTSTIKWHTFDDLLSGKNTNNKPVYMLIHTKWDGFSKNFNATTLTDNKVISYLNEVFFCVKFNAEDTKTYTLKNKKYGLTKIGRRNIHSLCLKWFGNTFSTPTHNFVDHNLKPIHSKPGYLNSEDFLFFIEALNLKKGSSKKLLNSNINELNTALKKIISGYKNSFINIRGTRTQNTSSIHWKSKVKIPNEIKSEIIHDKIQKTKYYSSTLLQKTSKIKAKKFIKDYVQVLLKSNLKKELKSYILTYKVYEKESSTSLRIFTHKEDSAFKNIKIELEIVQNGFFDENIVDVTFKIIKNDKF